MEDLKTLLDYVVIPLFFVIYRFNQRITILEARQITKEDIEKIYNKLDEIKENFIHVNTCNANHSIK